jgi:hypothetical protein
MKDELRKLGTVSRTYLITGELDKKLDAISEKLHQNNSKTIRGLIEEKYQSIFKNENPTEIA